MNLMKRLWKEEEGQDLVEYALLVVLISLGAIAAMKTWRAVSAMPSRTPLHN